MMAPGKSRPHDVIFFLVPIVTATVVGMITMMIGIMMIMIVIMEVMIGSSSPLLPQPPRTTTENARNYLVYDQIYDNVSHGRFGISFIPFDHDDDNKTIPIIPQQQQQQLLLLLLPTPLLLLIYHVSK
jgi:hypothetical protein